MLRDVVEGVIWRGSFFFFQAEDGIRDRTVTGVQTCALPIYGEGRQAAEGEPATAHRSAHLRSAGRGGAVRVGQPHRSDGGDGVRVHRGPRHGTGADRARHGATRSEERRVGKEWGAWGSMGSE